MKLIDEIGLQCTADTAVLQSHKGVIFLAYHPALLYQRSVDIHLAYIVYYHRKTNSLCIRQNAVKKCCLATSQITG